jgi:hypothetical protein
MKMITSTEWLLSFVIPEVVSSPEEQIATLKHTLSKLDMLPDAAKTLVSSGMLRYMQSLDSRGMLALKEYILDALTETELEGLLSLVGYAREQLRKRESPKSATRSSVAAVGGALSGLPPGVIVLEEQVEKWRNAVVDTKDYKKGDLLIFPNQKIF